MNFNLVWFLLTVSFRAPRMSLCAAAQANVASVKFHLPVVKFYSEKLANFYVDVMPTNFRPESSVPARPVLDGHLHLAHGCSTDGAWWWCGGSVTESRKLACGTQIN